MQVEYKNKYLGRLCTDASYAAKEFSVRMAEELQKRIDQIQSMDTIEHLLQFHIGGCHKLKGDRKGQFAMDLVKGYRLIFIVKGEDIQIAEIIDVRDYH